MEVNASLYISLICQPFTLDHVWAEFKNSHYGDFCITINLRLFYIIAVFLLGTQATRNSCQILEILLFLVLELLSLLLEVVYRATVLKGASASTIVRPREKAVLPDLRSLEWIYFSVFCVKYSDRSPLRPGGS